MQPNSGIAGLYSYFTSFSVTLINKTLNKRTTYSSQSIIEGIQGRNLRQEPGSKEHGGTLLADSLSGLVIHVQLLVYTTQSHLPSATHTAEWAFLYQLIIKTVLQRHSHRPILLGQFLSDGSRQ